MGHWDRPRDRFRRGDGPTQPHGIDNTGRPRRDHRTGWGASARRPSGPPDQGEGLQTMAGSRWVSTETYGRRPPPAIPYGSTDRPDGTRPYAPHVRTTLLPSRHITPTQHRPCHRISGHHSASCHPTPAQAKARRHFRAHHATARLQATPRPLTSPHNIARRHGRPRHPTPMLVVTSGLTRSAPRTPDLDARPDHVRSTLDARSPHSTPAQHSASPQRTTIHHTPRRHASARHNTPVQRTSRLGVTSQQSKPRHNSTPGHDTPLQITTRRQPSTIHPTAQLGVTSLHARTNQATTFHHSSSFHPAPDATTEPCVSPIQAESAALSSSLPESSLSLFGLRSRVSRLPWAA